MKIRILTLLTALIGTLCFGSCGTGGDLKVEELRCRDLVNPEGVDQAVLSWKSETKVNGAVQSAYEIEIASSEKALRQGQADLWSSGKVESAQQIDIRPDATLKSGGLYWWRVRVWDGNGTSSAWSSPASFSLGLTDADWQARWITSDWTESKAMPYFRKEFDAAKQGAKLVRAVVYFSGLGCGDLYLNGELADPTRILDPAQTNYEQYALYSTFDVTERLAKGVNCLGVSLGEGWYGQGRVWGPSFKYGDPLFILQMEITYDDGSKQTIVSDESWQWSPSPILMANIYAGESYDATKQIEGWAEPGTALEGWQQAKLAGGIIPPKLCPQVMEPIRLKEHIKPIAIWQDPAGNWIFDFGVNVAGVPSISVSQPAGTKLTMRMGETLNADSSINYVTTGVSATGVIQTDEYTCSGEGVETWMPRFTYHGYRYLELSGAATAPDPSWIETIRVYSDVARRGTFESSDEQINRLHELAVTTMLSNIHGIPTDCPHRERCGWLGDAHAVFPFENMNFDMGNFWIKYLADISSSSSTFMENTLHQKLYNNVFYFADKEPGIPHMISPGRRLCGVASPDWGTAVVQLPWYMYLYYGVEEPLKQYYGEMKQWVEHVSALSLNDTLPDKYIVPYGLGDWCPPGGNGNIDCPIPISSTAFHYYDVSLLAKSAEVLGKTEDAAHYNELKGKIADAFVATFYDSVNKTFGSQTADAMALDFGLVPEGDQAAVSNAIVKNMKEKYDNFMNCGIFGLGRIGQALSRHGNSQAAWDLFTKKGENSFAYMWEGAGAATSLWEALPTNKANIETEGSLSHPMQGGYDQWIYEDVAGIRPDASGPGFKVTRFEPTMMDQLSWARASLDTPYGTTISDWTNKEGEVIWIVVIPANAGGLVALPDGKQITVNARPFDAADFPKAEQQEGKALYTFPSGSYTIEIR